MNKRAWVLIVIAAAMAVSYVVYFTGWFDSDDILIVHQLRAATPPRPDRQRRQRPVATDPAVYRVLFTLDKTYPLTSIRVVEAAASEAGGEPVEVWHLV